MPSTHLGKLCCGLGVGSLVALGGFFALVAAGQRGGDTFFSNPWLSVAVLSAGGLAVAAAAVGARAVLRKAERGWAVFAFLAYGGLVAVFVLGELLFPH